MSLKQSCFKSIVKSDLKRAWWISALAALFIFISHTSQLFEYGTGGYNIFFGSARFDDALDYANYATSNYFIGMFAAVFTVLFLFSYLNKVNSVSFFHSLPTTRTSLLFSHITSGVIIVIFPMLINTLISLFTIGKGVKVTWILLGFAF